MIKIQRQETTRMIAQYTNAMIRIALPSCCLISGMRVVEIVCHSCLLTIRFWR